MRLDIDSGPAARQQLRHAEKGSPRFADRGDVTWRTTRVLVVCIVALFVPLLIPLCTRRVWTFDDLAALHVPLRYVYRKALRAGDSVLWSSAFYSGFYLYGEGQGGMGHPLHVLLYRVLPLDVAFNVEIISSYIAAVTGMRLLLPRLGLSREAAWFGGMVFAFSGFNLAHLVHVNAIAIVSHVPWLLFAAHVLVVTTDRGARAIAFGSVSLLLASELLLGYPQYVWMTFLAVGYFALCLAIVRAAPSRLLWLGAAVACGVLIGAVQLLPTLDVLRRSVRAAPSVDFRLSFSLPVLNVIQLWAPHAFTFGRYGAEDPTIHQFMGGESVYTGAFCSLALAWIAARWRALPHRALVGALLAFAAFNLLLAFGREGRLYTWLINVPGLNTLRAPARHLMLFHLALSGIAAVVFEDVLAVARRRERLPAGSLWPLGVFIVLTVLTTAVAAALAGSPSAASRHLMPSSLRVAGPWACMVIASALLFLVAGRGVSWSVPLLIVVAALDQGVWGYSFVLDKGSLQGVAALTAAARVPPEARPGDLFELMATGSGPPKNLGVLRDLRLSSGYLGLAPDVSVRADRLGLRLAGARWRIDGAGWVRMTDTMPRARLVSIAQRTDHARDDVRRIDIARVALVDRPIEGLEGAPGAARAIIDRPGHIVVDASTPGTQLLILTERFHDGWRVSEGDRSVPAIRVYGNYLGCVVVPGVHRIVFTFAPNSLRDGLRLMWLGLALTAGAIVVLWRLPAQVRGVRLEG